MRTCFFIVIKESKAFCNPTVLCENTGRFFLTRQFVGIEIVKKINAKACNLFIFPKFGIFNTFLIR